MDTNPHRILFVVHNAPPLNSGRARQALRLASELESNVLGVQIDVLSLDSQAIEVWAGEIDYRWQHETARWNYMRLLKLCLENKYRVVHFHGYSYLVGMARLLKKMGIRTVLNMSSRGYDNPSALLQKAWLGKFQRRSLAALDAWLVQNPADLGTQQNAVYLPNIVNIPVSLPKWSEREKQIVCSGVLCERKGQLDLIQAFGDMPNLAADGWKLLLCGANTNNYDEYVADYVEQCKTLAAKTPGVELTGHLTQSELATVLRRSRYFTALSSQEGLSNAYLECMAHGLQAILPPDREDDVFRDLNLTRKALRLFDADFTTRLLNDQHDCDLQSCRVARWFSLETILPRLLAIYGVVASQDKPIERLDRIPLDSLGKGE